jgi:NADH dehydrogenase [ubiquinone] 1 alpha subcomplex assembly factor 7
MASLKISQFVEKALFDESRGYYRTKNPLGKNSDFITAPEISQTFGESIALYLLQIFSYKKEKISLVEMGAGRGVMMFDILNSIKKLAEKQNLQALDFLECASFHIIEINEVLVKIQQEKLCDFNVKWHKSFSDFEKISDKFFFISNEIFDCFPIDQFVLTEIGWRERIIVNKNFTLAPFEKKIHNFVEQEIATLAPIGAVFEYSKTARDFMNELCAALKNKGGIAINFDYGYFKNEFANTLQALKNHKKTDIFEEGCDITAHVDFGTLDKITKDYSLNSSLITQREFLISLRINDRKKNLIEKNPQLEAEINSAINRLIDVNQMGELFKCHIIWK